MNIPISRGRAAIVFILPIGLVALGVWILASPAGMDIFGIDLPQVAARLLSGLFILFGLVGSAQLLWRFVVPEPGVAIEGDNIVVRAGLGRTKRIPRGNIRAVSVDRSWPQVLTLKVKDGSDVSIHMFLLETDRDVTGETLARQLSAFSDGRGADED